MNYTQDLDLSKIQELPSGIPTNDAQNSMHEEDTSLTPKVNPNKPTTASINVLEQIR